MRIGIIENEFGEKSIDAKLIAGYQPESIVELNNGCICCSIYNEFSLTLQQLIQKHDHLEQLIIETTGVADPGPVIEPFFQDEDLIRLFEFSGTICLVDGINFLKVPLDFRQKKQIILSDLIILNKIGDTDPYQLPKIRQRILALNPAVSIVETNQSRIDDSQFFNLNPQLQDDFRRKIRQPIYSEPDESEFHSFTIRFIGLVNENRFRNWFNYVVSVHKQKIFRIKGILYWDNNPLLGIVQSVGGTISITEGSVVNPYEPIENVLVFIGKDISKFEIEKEFNQFLLQEN